MTTWFDGARFGMFVHWGHVSQRGLGAVVAAGRRRAGAPRLPGRAGRRVPRERGDLRPAARDAARDWLRARAARRHAVRRLHHQAPRRLRDVAARAPTDFSIAHSPYGGDLVREFVDAARADGLRVGLYFSLSDWHHPDYPAFTDADRPYRFGTGAAADAGAVGALPRLPVRRRSRELLTGYGAIDLLWFDGGWERSRDEWRARRARGADPRAAAGHPDQRPPARRGDFDTPEQFVPPQPPGAPWETCLTMNESWGYNPSDTRLQVGARARAHAVRDRGPRRQPAAQRQPDGGRRALPRRADRAPRRDRRLDGRARREHPSTRAGPRAVAVLRPDHAAR